MSRSERVVKNCHATYSQAYPRASFTPGSSLVSSLAEKCPFNALRLVSAFPRCLYHSRVSSEVWLGPNVQEGGDERNMVDLVREVDYERLQSAALLTAPKILKRCRKLDGMFEVSGCGQDRGQPRYSARTCWLSLSTRSPKLSLSSTLGTPASSDGHRGVDGSDIVTEFYYYVKWPAQPWPYTILREYGAAS
jgi:hypothetical protein